MKTKSILKTLDAQVKKLLNHRRNAGAPISPKTPKKHQRATIPDTRQGRVVVAS